MINLNDLKTFLRISDNTLDGFLLGIIDMSVGRINNICRRNINYGSRDDIIDGKEQDIIWLKDYPVEKVTAIKYRIENSGFIYDLFEGSNIQANIYLENRSGKLILLNGYRLPVGSSNVKISYFAGYMENAPVPDCEIPADLKYICLLMSAQTFLKSFQNAEDDFKRRVGLEAYEKYVKEATATETKISLKYTEEDFDELLDRYKSLRII